MCNLFAAIQYSLLLKKGMWSSSMRDSYEYGWKYLCSGLLYEYDSNSLIWANFFSMLTNREYHFSVFLK